MSIAYILDNNTNQILNEKLNQELEVETSIKAPIHYIEDLTISKGATGSLVLNAPVVEATIIETDSINAVSGVFTSALNPLLNTNDIDINGNLNMSSYQLDVGSIYANGSTGSNNQVLSKNSENILSWSNPSTPATPTLSQVLTAGNTASANIDMSLNQIQNCATLRVNNLNNVSGQGQINLNCNLNFGNVNQNQIFCGRLNTSTIDATTQCILGRAPNRFNSATSFAMNYIDNSNIFRSESVADLIDFHDFKSNRGKIYIVDGSNNEKFSADDTGLINCNQLNPTYKPERTLYVSQNNTNANKTGSFENPFSTIQSAIDYAESLYNNTYWYINVLTGNYSENLTITKKIFIKGCAPSNPDANSVGCQLNGSITISIDTNDADMFNNAVSISNLFITGSIECNSGNTARSVLILTDCYIYQDSGNGRLIHYNPDASDGRLWMFNCRIIDQSITATLPIIEINKGMIKMLQCVVSGAGNENILKIANTARIDSIVLCSFSSTTNSTTAEPIVELSSNGAVLTFSQCAFIYSNNANKSASVNSCAILLNNSDVGFFPTLNIQNCSFSLLGTSQTANFAIEDANFGTAKQAIILAYGNNSIIGTSFQVRGTYNVNKFSNQTSDSIKTPLLETTNLYVNGSNGTSGQFLQKDTNNNLVWGSGGGGSSQNLEQTLQNGNTAGTYDINMSNNDITNINQIEVSSIYTNGSTGSINQVLAKNSSNVLSWIDQSGGGAFSPTQTLYVDAGNTSASPDGSINNPYINISQAVAYAEANFDVTKYWVVNIAPGSYGTFTITKPRIYFNGVNDNSNYIISNDAPCKITGDVIISFQTAGGNNPIIAFDSLYFNNASIYDRSATIASTQSYNLVLNNCQMEMTTAKDSIIHLQPNSASNLLVTNSRFSSTIALSSTRMLNLVISFSKINVQNSVFFTSQNNICIYFESIAHLEEVKNCIFTNSTNNNTPLAMIRGSTNNSSPVSIIQNQFIYSTNAGRVANSRAIFIGGTTFQLQCFLVNNFFNLLGFQNDSFVAGDGSPASANGCRYNYFGNCSAVGTTNLIEGVDGEGKRALLSVS
jgi:hypothetical protein